MNPIISKLQKIANLHKWKINRDSERNTNTIITLETHQAQVNKLTSENQENLEYMIKHINLIENKGLQWCIKYALAIQQETINRHEEIHRELREEILESIKQRNEEEKYLSTKLENILSKPEH